MCIHGFSTSRFFYLHYYCLFSYIKLIYPMAHKKMKIYKIERSLIFSHHLNYDHDQ